MTPFLFLVLAGFAAFILVLGIYSTRDRLLDAAARRGSSERA
jgi:hypothetical protein